MNRRSLVTTAGGLLLASAGCLTGDETDEADTDTETPGTDTETSEVETSTDDSTAETTGQRRDTPCDEIDERSRLGGDDGASIEAETDREYEYLEGEDRIRIEYPQGGTNEMPFEEWGTRCAAEAAAEYVRSSLEETGVLETVIAVGRGQTSLDDLDGDDPDSAEFERALPSGVSVSHGPSYGRDGALLSRPSIDFGTLVDSTPRSVTVTMNFEERDYTAVLPVVCRRTCEQVD